MNYNGVRRAVRHGWVLVGYAVAGALVRKVLRNGVCVTLLVRDYGRVVVRDKWRTRP